MTDALVMPLPLGLRAACLLAAAAVPRESLDADASGPDSADVALSQTGDGEAFQRLVRRHQVSIARQMWRFTRDPREHAELVQDVFVNAYLSLPSYRATGPFLHWLRKVAVRTGYAYWRDRRRNEAEVPLDDSVAANVAAAEGPAASRAAAELVHHLLARLPPRDRLVLTLFYLDELSLGEIAALTGWSTVMVKVQCWRARAKLKKLLKEF